MRGRNPSAVQIRDRGADEGRPRRRIEMTGIGPSAKSRGMGAAPPLLMSFIPPQFLSSAGIRSGQRI